MNVYHALNEMTGYIEEHLTDRIDYHVLANILGVNEYTMKSLFSLLCDMSLSDYIRSRRLSDAGYDLYSGTDKVIDVAIKYGYNNATSFSRAFERFHGMKPGEVRKNPKQLKNFPRLTFQENTIVPDAIEYRILELEELVLYGIGFQTSCEAIRQEVPDFFERMQQQYCFHGNVDYGMTVYADRFEHGDCEYWVLWKNYAEGLQEYRIPGSKWLAFSIPTDEAEDIQARIQQFYFQFLPSCKYNLRDLPELEYYHDNKTEFLVSIED